jgi:hypothetical protein
VYSSANNLAASTNGGPGLAYTPAPANVFERDRVMQSNSRLEITRAEYSLLSREFQQLFCVSYCH